LTLPQPEYKYFNLGVCSVSYQPSLVPTRLKVLNPN
jgi:hypothetical protein